MYANDGNCLHYIPAAWIAESKVAECSLPVADAQGKRLCDTLCSLTNGSLPTVEPPQSRKARLPQPCYPVPVRATA